MILTDRHRIKDSSKIKLIMRWSESVNFVWNYCKEVATKAWRYDQKILSAYDLTGLTKGCSKELGISSKTIAEVCKEFCKRRSQNKRIPKWRSRKRSLPWVPFPGDAIQIRNDRISYVKNNFKVWLSRPSRGLVKSGCIVINSVNKAFICLNVEVETKMTAKATSSVGIDPGFKTILNLSDGSKCERPNFTRKYANQLSRAQRAKHKKQVSKLHQKVKNSRCDWAHKTTTQIVQKFDNIFFGDIKASKPKGFRKNPLYRSCFSKSIYDAGWYQIKTLLAYKSKLLGKVYLPVNEFGSTSKCSTCGALHHGPQGLRGLSVREWKCAACGTVHDRDTNAATNILRLGLETLFKGAALCAE